MKKKPEKKLVLHREALLELSREENRIVAGGWFTDTCDSCNCIG